MMLTQISPCYTGHTTGMIRHLATPPMWSVKPQQPTNRWSARLLTTAVTPNTDIACLVINVTKASILFWLTDKNLLFMSKAHKGE